MSQRIFNEYIVIRDRKLKKFGESYELERYVFNYWFKGYLCRKKEGNIVDARPIVNNEEVSSIMSLIYSAKTKGMHFDEFAKEVEKVINDYNIIRK